MRRLPAGGGGAALSSIVLALAVAGVLVVELGGSHCTYSEAPRFQPGPLVVLAWLALAVWALVLDGRALRRAPRLAGLGLALLLAAGAVGTWAFVAAVGQLLGCAES
jgi:hypothetical protein